MSTGRQDPIFPVGRLQRVVQAVRGYKPRFWGKITIAVSCLRQIACASTKEYYPRGGSWSLLGTKLIRSAQPGVVCLWHLRGLNHVLIPSTTTLRFLDAHGGLFAGENASSHFHA